MKKYTILALLSSFIVVATQAMEPSNTPGTMGAPTIDANQAALNQNAPVIPGTPSTPMPIEKPISAPMPEIQATEVPKTPAPPVPVGDIKKEAKKEEIKKTEEPDKPEKVTQPLGLPLVEAPKVTVKTEQKPEIKAKTAQVCEQPNVWSTFDELEAKIIKSLPIIEDYVKKNPADNEKVLTRLMKSMELIGMSFEKILGKPIQELMAEAQAEQELLNAKAKK